MILKRVSLLIAIYILGAGAISSAHASGEVDHYLRHRTQNLAAAQKSLNTYKRLQDWPKLIDELDRLLVQPYINAALEMTAETLNFKTENPAVEANEKAVVRISGFDMSLTVSFISGIEELVVPSGAWIKKADYLKGWLIDQLLRYPKLMFSTRLYNAGASEQNAGAFYRLKFLPADFLSTRPLEFVRPRQSDHPSDLVVARQRGDYLNGRLELHQFLIGDLYEARSWQINQGPKTLFQLQKFGTYDLDQESRRNELKSWELTALQKSVGSYLLSAENIGTPSEQLTHILGLHRDVEVSFLARLFSAEHAEGWANQSDKEYSDLLRLIQFQIVDIGSEKIEFVEKARLAKQLAESLLSDLFLMEISATGDKESWNSIKTAIARLHNDDGKSANEYSRSADNGFKLLVRSIEENFETRLFQLQVDGTRFEDMNWVNKTLHFVSFLTSLYPPLVAGDAAKNLDHPGAVFNRMKLRTLDFNCTYLTQLNVK